MLKEMIKLSDVQQGFRTGRSCIDAVFISKHIAEKALEVNKLLYILVCFVDLEKTFDFLDLWNILNILQENDVPNGIILLIKNIYSNNFNHIRMQSELTVTITRRVRQGDSLSQLLFSIVMDKNVRYMKHLQGYRM